MKKKVISGIGVFVAVTVAAYLFMFSGRDLDKIVELGSSTFMGFLGVVAYLFEQVIRYRKE